MIDSDHLDQAPEARLGQIPVPWRRPMVLTTAGSLCWFLSVTMGIGITLVLSHLIRTGTRYGWGNVLLSGLGLRIFAGLGLMAMVMVALVFSGREFFGGRGRGGLIIGFLASIGWCLGKLLLRNE